ncbi:Cupredoxin [Aureobasidium pullulans]|nr:Cupredoxin [Aureobasidium pullulans]
MPSQLLYLAFLALHTLSASAAPQAGSPRTSSLIASGISGSATGTATSASAPAFSTTVSYSNGTTKSLASCAANMNGSLPTTSGFTFNGTVRRYYVAAEEVEWDYAPTGWDNWLGVPFNDSIRARNAGYIEYGTVWTKALYRGYTDATFTQRTAQPAWQGTQGPILRAEVGDIIEILFVNNLTRNYATMHSMGLAYQKSSEGADYPDAAAGVNFQIPEEDGVPPVEPGLAPGGCVVYKWMVPEFAGPNENEPARIHSYHSYVSLYEDANAGLIGPTIIYRQGEMDMVVSEYREIPFLFMIYTESVSFLSGVNAERLTSQKNISPDIAQLYSSNSSVWYPQEVNIAGAEHFSSAPPFRKSRTFFSKDFEVHFTEYVIQTDGINGYVFSNNPTFEMCVNDKVLWYVMAYGSASHVFHMHGNGYKHNGVKQYATSINDGVGKTFVMDATGTGMWQVICHVDHRLPTTRFTLTIVRLNLWHRPRPS